MGYRHMSKLALVAMFSSEPDSTSTVTYITLLRTTEMFLPTAKFISNFVLYFSLNYLFLMLSIYIDSCVEELMYMCLYAHIMFLYW